MSRRLAIGGSAALLVVSIAGAWPQSIDNDDPLAVTWEKWSPERVESLREEGRTVYVDFTARWCATCQTNKATVFGSRKVLERFAEENIATLKADWTSRDSEITKALESFGRSAVPFNVIYGPDDRVILPEILTPGIVLDALTSLRTEAGTGEPEAG